MPIINVGDPCYTRTRTHAQSGSTFSQFLLIDSRAAYAPIGPAGHDWSVTQHQAHQRARRLSEDTRGVRRFAIFPYRKYLGSVKFGAQQAFVSAAALRRGGLH